MALVVTVLKISNFKSGVWNFCLHLKNRKKLLKLLKINYFDGSPTITQIENALGIKLLY